jgi:AhpD family alkylhydroperoxidase
MQARLNARAAAPDALKAVMGVESYLNTCGLERSLIHLVKMRASQINGCAFCLDKHGRDARRHGETEQRLYLLNAWRESSIYSARERAALDWTDALTMIADSHAPDEVFDQVRAQFADDELVNLTILIGQINLLNRLAIGFRNQHPVDGGAALASAAEGGA